MARRCPTCRGKLSKNGHCRHCGHRPPVAAKATAPVKPDGAAIAARDRELRDEPLDVEMRQAVRKWEALCETSKNTQEIEGAKLARLIVLQLVPNPDLAKHGQAWLTDVVNPLLDKALAAAGSNHPHLLRATAFRDRVAQRLVQSIPSPSPDAGARNEAKAAGAAHHGESPKDRLDKEMLEAVREWEALCETSKNTQEIEGAKLARLIVLQLVPNPDLAKHGRAWLTDVVNPLLDKALAAAGSNHPHLLRATAFRDRVAQRLVTSISNRSPDAGVQKATKPPLPAQTAEPVQRRDVSIAAHEVRPAERTVTNIDGDKELTISLPLSSKLAHEQVATIAERLLPVLAAELPEYEMSRADGSDSDYWNVQSITLTCAEAWHIVDVMTARIRLVIRVRDFTPDGIGCAVIMAIGTGILSGLLLSVILVGVWYLGGWDVLGAVFGDSHGGSEYLTATSVLVGACSVAWLVFFVVESIRESRRYVAAAGRRQRLRNFIANLDLTKLIVGIEPEPAKTNAAQPSFDGAASSARDRELRDDLLDEEMLAAVREWETLCETSKNAHEIEGAKLARFIVLQLVPNPDLEKHGRAWLTNVVNPLFDKARAAAGPNHPLLLRATAFRDRVARRLERSTVNPPHDTTRRAGPADQPPRLRFLEEVQRQVRDVIANYHGGKPESLKSATRLDHYFGDWHWKSVARNAILERLEDSFGIPIPLNVEKTLRTVGDLEQFFAAAREHEASSKYSAGLHPVVACDLCDEIRDDEVKWEYFSPWRRSVKLDVDAGAWTSWIGTKRIRLQLRALLPGWKISISSFWRDNGEVRIDLTNPQHYSHSICIDRDGGKLHPLDRDLSGDRVRLGIDRENKEIVCFRIRGSYFQEPAAYAMDRGLKWGCLGGLLIVVSIAIAGLFLASPWVETFPMLRQLPLSEMPWLFGALAGIVFCALMAFAGETMSRIWSARANGRRRREYKKWTNERTQVQIAVSRLDVAAAYGA